MSIAAGRPQGHRRAGRAPRSPFGEQLPDGGWNCEVENGATVSSLGTTINVLEGLLDHERAIDGSDIVGDAREGDRRTVG